MTERQKELAAASKQRMLKQFEGIQNREPLFVSTEEVQKTKEDFDKLMKQYDERWEQMMAEAVANYDHKE